MGFTPLKVGRVSLLIKLEMIGEGGDTKISHDKLWDDLLACEKVNLSHKDWR